MSESSLLNPVYHANLLQSSTADLAFRCLLAEAWEERVSARRELFMAPKPTEYTYGKGKGVRTYTAKPFTPVVEYVLDVVKDVGVAMYNLNACFLNRYDGAQQALGWHADDFEGMDHLSPVVVVSLGSPREIWWRKKGETGEVPKEQRKLLQHGSLFMMPAGFQQAFDHRIPKADRDVGTRISLTFRAFKETS